MLSIDDAIAEINERQRTLYGEAPAAAPPSCTAAGCGRRRRSRGQPAPGHPSRLRHLQPGEATAPDHDADRIAAADQRPREASSRPFATTSPTSGASSPKRCRATPWNRLKSRSRRWRSASIIPASSASNRPRSPGSNAGLRKCATRYGGLTPAENLVGFDDAVKTLAQKVDLIIAKEDPAALQQLETAIGALRGIVSHVASNDTLTKVAEDVRALAGKGGRVSPIARRAGRPSRRSKAASIRWPMRSLPRPKPATRCRANWRSCSPD